MQTSFKLIFFKITNMLFRLTVPALDGALFPLATPTYTRILMVSEISTCRLLVPKSCSRHAVTPAQTRECKIHCMKMSTASPSGRQAGKLTVGTAEARTKVRSDKERGQVRGQVQVSLWICVLRYRQGFHDIMISKIG